MKSILVVLSLSVVAGCSNAPAASSTPPAAKAELPAKPAAPAMEPKVQAPAKPAAVQAIDKTPIKADVSKIKFQPEGELFGWDEGESRAFFYANGTGELVVKVPADGEYDVVVTASCAAANGQNAKFKLKADGAAVGAETQLKSEDAKDYPFTAPLKSGDRKFAVEFTNDLYKEGEYDLNFFLNGLKLVRVK